MVLKVFGMRVDEKGSVELGMDGNVLWVRREPERFDKMKMIILGD